MNLATPFPYPCLLSELRNSPTVALEEYYSIRPHKTVRLLVKLKQQKESLSGVYVFASENNIQYLQRYLGSSLKVHSFENESQPWLFLDDSNPGFQKDLDKLISWIKEIKNKA